MFVIDYLATTPPAAYGALLGVPLVASLAVSYWAIHGLERLAIRWLGGR